MPRPYDPHLLASGQVDTLICPSATTTPPVHHRQVNQECSVRGCSAAMRATTRRPRRRRGHGAPRAVIGPTAEQSHQQQCRQRREPWWLLL